MNDNTRQLLDFQYKQLEMLQQIRHVMYSVNTACVLICVWLVLRGVLFAWQCLLYLDQMATMPIEQY